MPPSWLYLHFLRALSHTLGNNGWKLRVSLISKSVNELDCKNEAGHDFKYTLKALTTFALQELFLNFLSNSDDFRANERISKLSLHSYL